MPSKRGLGKGIDVLIPEKEKSKNESITKLKEVVKEVVKEVDTIDINKIEPNGQQPRKNFDEDSLNDLADSIKQHGMIEPLIVKKSENGFYNIIAGERRWRAARIAGLKEVPVIVKDYTSQQIMEVALIENLQREDLNPIEEAEGLNQMIKTYGLTQAEVSKSVSKSRPYITNALRLLKLPEAIKEYVVEGQLTTGHARALLAIEDEEKQMLLCRKVIEDGLSVRKIEELAKAENTPKKKPAKKKKSADTVHVEGELKNIFGTKVSIEKKGKKGVIQLEYYSTEELNRLIELLKTVG